MYFPLPIYEIGVEQRMIDGLPQFIHNQPLDYSKLIAGIEDEIEIWEPAVNKNVADSTKTVDFQLNGNKVTTDVVLLRLKIKGVDNDSYVMLVRLTGSFEKRLYPGEATSRERFEQAAFYGRAVLAGLMAFGVTVDIFQVHEAFPPVALIPDLFENPVYKDNLLFKTGKENIIGFAHTVVLQAFPSYDHYWIQDVLGLTYDQYRGYLREDKKYDPFYALSLKAVAIGSVGPEHREAMKFAFPKFSHKYFAIEDSIWPFFWMLPSQISNNSRIMELEEIWDAKMQAQKNMLEFLKNELGVTLMAGRPTITQARRFTDFKANTFFTKVPGFDKLKGAYYITADPQQGGLGFNLIIGGKAHESDSLCQSWVEQINAMLMIHSLPDVLL